MTDLSGKVAIVTGGASGIGFAIAKEMIKENMNVVLASRREDLLQQKADELNSMNSGKAIISKCDLRDHSGIKNTIQTALNSFGKIDVLINNSGIGIQKKVVDMNPDDWDFVMDTNLKGTFLISKEVLPAMINQKSGYIINIASQAAKHGYPEASVYCASKFGILGFAESLQQEVREFGIRVHSLCPALVQVPPPNSDNEIREGILQVDDLANTVMFLLKQPRRIKFEDIGLYHI